MKVYKGTDKNMKCRGYQYEIGKTEVTDSAVLCKSGFHACERPLDVLGYYPPNNSRYFEAEAEDVSPERNDYSKIVCKRLTLVAEIGIAGLVKDHVEYVNEHLEHSAAPATNTGNWSVATNTGEQSAATNTGNWSVATNTGNRSAATNTGEQSAATNTGNWSAATNTGNRSAATNTGYRSAATNTGDYSAATNTGYRSAATNTGDYSAATNTGYRSAATNTGNCSAATAGGKGSVAIVTGHKSKAKADLGCAICVCERDDYYNLLAIKAAIVDGETIKADTWYTMVNGEFVEVEEER